MKITRFKRANWVVAMAMLALPGALLTSCSKETNPTEQVEPKGDKLVISVKGANIQKSNAPLKQGSSSKAKTNTATTVPTVYEFADADMAVSVGNNLPVKTINMATGAKRSGLAADVSTQAVEVVETGVKYVIYLYEGNNFVSSALLEAGTAGTVEGLNPEGSYTWVALSYNDIEDAPTETPSSADVELMQNKDVLYASGAINLAESNTIDITFDHLLSRIGIELNTIGVFGEITGTPAISVSGLALTTGSLNLLTGDVTPSGSTFDPVLSYADFENVDPNYDDAKIAYVYTASTNALNLQLSVAAPGLTISHADGGLLRTYFAGGANVSSSITPEMGKSHRVLFNVVESALTGPGGVQWGRSNLYYRGNNGDPLRSYAFNYTNALRSRADGYFSYGGTVPFQFPTEATSGDPCALVYPAGLWVQPTAAQVNTLTSSQGLLSGVLNAVGDLLGGLLGTVGADPAPGGSTVGASYAQYSVTAGGGSAAFDEASNNLRFYYNGQVTNTALLSGIGTDGSGLLGLGLSSLSVDLAGNNLLSLGIDAGSGLSLPVLQAPILGTSYDVQAAFWSRTGNVEIPLLGTSVGSWGYSAFTQTPRFLGARTGPDFVKATTTAELLSNIDLLGIDLLNTSFKNVRCVRAPQPAP